MTGVRPSHGQFGMHGPPWAKVGFAVLRTAGWGYRRNQGLSSLTTWSHCLRAPADYIKCRGTRFANVRSGRCYQRALFVQEKCGSRLVLRRSSVLFDSRKGSISPSNLLLSVVIFLLCLKARFDFPIVRYGLAPSKTGQQFGMCKWTLTGWIPEWFVGLTGS